MIINIRGTSGSGKSTLARKIMERYGSRYAHRIIGRKQPLGYIYQPKKQGQRSLAIVGHYETECGGCDTISSMDQIFNLVRKSHDAGLDVIFEGLLISADHKRTLALHEEGRELYVVSLQEVAVEECLASVNDRRLRRLGPEKYTPVKEKNTISKHRGVIKSCEALERDGVKVLRGDRAQAEATLVRLLRLGE